LICFLARFGKSFLRAVADRSELCDPSFHLLVRWGGVFVRRLGIEFGGRELVRRFDGRRLWSLWGCLRLDNSWLGKGISCFSRGRTGFCSLSFRRCVNFSRRGLRRFRSFRKIDERRALQGYRQINLCGTTAFGLFQGLGLHCLLLGRNALRNCKPRRLWDRMAILRQGFPGQDLERGRSRTLLPWDELVLHPALLAKLSAPMAQTATARLEAALLMRSSRGAW
jgi:hypothetical protein